MKLKVLIGCEYSGVMREAFRKLGHDAWSCDLLDSEDGSENHFKYDVFAAMRCCGGPWDFIMLHPPCTRLTVSGQWYVQRNPEAQVEQLRAIAFTQHLWEEARNYSRHVALENPVGILSTKSDLGKPSQIVQPYEYGDDASKKTCLWLHNLPKLTPTKYVEPRMVGGKPRWANQTDSGQNRLPPSEDRWKERSRTYPGIAAAAAEQWSNHIINAQR